MRTSFQLNKTPNPFQLHPGGDPARLMPSVGRERDADHKETGSRKSPIRNRLSTNPKNDWSGLLSKCSCWRI